MILTDYFRSNHDSTWDYAKQCGVNHGVIRLPEDEKFDITNYSHWQSVHEKFIDFGIKPIVIEPMPNELHDHIKIGDNMRDESIEKVIKMFDFMNELDIRTICFNFMAHIGWLRTESNIKERGGALVTGFNYDNFNEVTPKITEEELWHNYEYFIKAVMPYAEEKGIKLALHPDDPPIAKIGNVSRIFINRENIKKAIEIANSDNFGLTFCQATYLMMGEDLYKIIPELAKKIFFVHFRNTTGEKYNFRETFHDNGNIDMAEIMKLYKSCGIDVPIRVDHVPSMFGEQENTGYTALGRLFAIGYLKGILDAI